MNCKFLILPSPIHRHDNQVGRWLTNFRATWDPKFDSYAVVGSMKQPNSFETTVISQRRNFFLPYSHLALLKNTSFLRDNVFHPSVNKLAGGNSSGKVYLWTE
ncbi:unnamed protein product [Porites evermanni]|uniref:Uncharacterized protein n=1 Tax=Porites evermanni TaxID=104178 RepID=A0ABN8QDN7_9CNID|nr:unnamed protein product [Porites evermanni]